MTGTIAQESSSSRVLDDIFLASAERPSQSDPSYSSMPLGSNAKNQVAPTGISTIWQPGTADCVTASDSISMMQPQSTLLPRAPVVLSYTMDEPYNFSNQYGSSIGGIELAGNFAGY